MRLLTNGTPAGLTFEQKKALIEPLLDCIQIHQYTPAIGRLHICVSIPAGLVFDRKMARLFFVSQETSLCNPRSPFPYIDGPLSDTDLAVWLYAKLTGIC